MYKNTPNNVNDIKNRNKNQFSFLFNTFTKSRWIDELTKNDSSVYTLIKEEVEVLFLKNGGYLKNIDFDGVYRIAIEITINQIKGSIKKNNRIFFENETNCNLLIYKKTKERLANNIKNLFDPKRKINLINVEYWIMNDVYEYNEFNSNIRDLQKLAKSNPHLIKENMTKLIKNFELDYEETTELAKKIGIDLSYLFEDYLISKYNKIKKDVNNQTYMIFVDEEMVA